MQLSIRLYWLEKEQAKAQAIVAATQPGASVDPQNTATGSSTQSGAGSSKDATSGGAFSKIKPYLLYAVVGGGGVVLSIVAVLLAWMLWRRTRSYHFPVIEVPNRLEANYAAGVGAVLAFHNKQGSPSSQRDQVPDYLTRM